MSGVASGQRLHFLPQRWMLEAGWMGGGGQQGVNFKGQGDSGMGPRWVWTTASVSSSCLDSDWDKGQLEVLIF